MLPVKGKGKGKVWKIELHLTAIWDHKELLPSTRHKYTHPALTPARRAGTQYTYSAGMVGWVDLGDLLHSEMVHTSADGHPSKY